MANATDRVKKGVVGRTDEYMRRSSATLAAATTFYTHAMIGVNASGYLAKFDDTQALRFAGVVRGREGNPVLPIGTQGDGTIDLDIHQPFRFELAVSGVAISDIGRRVYATFDNAGTLDAGATTYSNLIGTIVDYVASGIALVEAEYAPAQSDKPLQILSASGAVPIKTSTCIITKGSIAALTLADPTTGLHDGVEMTFISATAFAHTLDNSAGSGFNAGGGASDVGTFGGAKGDGITLIAYAGDWYVKDKTNVTLA